MAKRSFLSAPLAVGVRAVVDLDADGVSAFLGGGDCDDFDAAVHPRALEIVGNGVDDNCLGGDLVQVSVPGPGNRAPPASAPASRPTLPDVLVLSLDAVRADHFTPALMPALHARAVTGIHPEVAYTPAPYTGFASIGVMSSSTITDHHAEGRFFGYEPALARVLRRGGYHTVAVHCMVDLPADMVQGFELVDNRLAPMCDRFQHITSDAMARVVLGHLGRRPADGPLFLWAHFNDPHLPHIGGYEAELRRLDRAVGRVLAAARPDTIVVIFSDHGESFGAHGHRGHIWRLDEELVRVVIGVWGPGVPRRRPRWPTSLIDIAPTLTELLGLPAPAGWQGRSLLREPAPRAIVFESEYKGQLDLRGIRFGDHKITLDRRQGVYELYNVVEDPDDRHNLVGERPELFARMKARLGRVFDAQYNDRRLQRKLRLLRGRAITMPRHLGPLLPGQSTGSAPRGPRK